MVLVAAVAVAASCARAEQPPGHGPDFEPPAVVDLFPSHGAVVPDLDEDAFVRFDEPLGDPRSIERALVASPAWPYIVNAGRRNVRIRPRDGWRSGVVYQFTIPAGLRDLIRNQTREPVEFLFSTGEDITSTSTGGRVRDRVSLGSVRDARILVIGADSVPYTAVTDTAGRFAIASLPVGDYWAFGFRDQNRNLILDREFEAHDSSRVELLDPQTRVELDLWLIPPDSTPPVLISAAAADSLQVLLSFDEILEPDFPLDSASVDVRRQDDGQEWPVASFAVGQPEPAAPPAGMDAESPDEVGLDEEPPPAEAEPPPGDIEVEAQELAVDSAATDLTTQDEERGRPLATVVVRLARPLTPATYEVSARGFANLRLLVGGGDTTFVYEPPPEPAPADEDAVPDTPDPAAPDGESP